MFLCVRFEYICVKEETNAFTIQLKKIKTILGAVRKAD